MDPNKLVISVRLVEDAIVVLNDATREIPDNDDTEEVHKLVHNVRQRLESLLVDHVRKSLDDEPRTTDFG